MNLNSYIASSYDYAEAETDEFFNRIANGESIGINGIKLTDRPSQSSYALSVMDALKSKEVLLIQAGVGTGKSFGYLIPIFNTINKVTSFNKVIISTSSIALQQQLLTDINKVSKLLDIPIKAEIAKGINNYVCMSKIDNLLSLTKDKEYKDYLKAIYYKMLKEKSADKADLFDISKETWEKIKADGRGRCSNCAYSQVCDYQTHVKKLLESNIVITNHSFLGYSLKQKSSKMFDDADAIIIDEAHNLEDTIRNSTERQIKLDEIVYRIKKLNSSKKNSEFKDLIPLMQNLYKNIKDNIYSVFKNNENINYRDLSIVGFNYNKNIKEDLNQISILLDKLIRTAKNKRENEYDINFFSQVLLDINDMLKGTLRNNIYYASFIAPGKIVIKCVTKDISKTMEKIYTKKIPVILTSGTMIDNNGTYDYFERGIGLDKYQTNKTEEIPLESSFDFKNNSLVYYNPSLITPPDKDSTAQDRQNYIYSLAGEINRLITATDGKALILFTSKKDMKDVFEILRNFDHDFKLLIQDDQNLEVLKNEFTTDTNSCLFATGSFWEGIDIRGKTLSNLIICRLPYPIVDPIAQAKANIYSEESRYEKVYLPEMLKKLAQGAGRLIRSDTDTGICCLLDSRVGRDIDSIKKVLPFVNYTTSFAKVLNFANNNLINEEKKHRIR